MTRPVIYRCAVIVSVLFMVLSACENDIKTVEARGHHKEEPEEAHGVDAYFHQGQTLKARLTAPYMLRFNDTLRTEFPTTLHCDFYDSLQRVQSRLDARYGIYHENTSQVYLRDSVRIVDLVKKDTIYCQDLTWDQNTGTFTTHRLVEIHKPDMLLKGKGMKSNQDFSHATIDTLYNSLLHVQQGQMP